MDTGEWNGGLGERNSGAGGQGEHLHGDPERHFGLLPGQRSVNNGLLGWRVLAKGALCFVAERNLQHGNTSFLKVGGTSADTDTSACSVPTSQLPFPLTHHVPNPHFQASTLRSREVSFSPYLGTSDLLVPHPDHWGRSHFLKYQIHPHAGILGGEWANLRVILTRNQVLTLPFTSSLTENKFLIICYEIKKKKKPESWSPASKKWIPWKLEHTLSSPPLDPHHLRKPVIVAKMKWRACVSLSCKCPFPRVVANWERM